MKATVAQLDPHVGRGLVMTWQPRTGQRRVFPFSAADVLDGVPRVGQRSELSFVWPSTGQPFGTDLRLLDAPAERSCAPLSPPVGRVPFP